MNAFILPKAVYDKILDDLNEIKQRINDLTGPDERFIENVDFLKLMNVSQKTAHTWRLEKKIAYSKEGNKVYYRMTDIVIFLDRFYHKALPEEDELT